MLHVIFVFGLAFRVTDSPGQNERLPTTLMEGAAGGESNVMVSVFEVETQFDESDTCTL